MIKRAVRKISSLLGIEIKKRKNKQIKKNIKEFTKLGKHSNIQGAKLDIRNPKPGKIYFEIGSDSLISGNFVFENGEGKIKIGNNTFIGGGLFVSIEEIEIGNDVMFSWGCTVMDTDAHSLSWELRKTDVVDWKKGIDENAIGKFKNWSHVNRKKIMIKDKVWVGFNTIILKGVTVGEGAIIGAGSVVVKDIPAWCIAAGNPATIIRMIPENER